MINNIETYLQENISSRRLRHIYGVVDTAVILADIYKVNVDQVRLAALLHDITKEKKSDFHKNYFDRIDDDLVINTPALWHGFTGAYFAQEKFQVEDTVILDAIKYHTISGVKMSLVAKIIFIADFCEPNRTFGEASLIRSMFGKNLNTVFNEVIKLSYEHNEKMGNENHQNLKYLYANLQSS